jgi:hypothetical protein
VVLAVVASVAVGIAMFGTSVFLSQYMQIARGKSPTEVGLLSIQMVIGLFTTSTIIGRVITRTGRYKRWMLLGTLLLTVGLALMGTMDETTNLVEIAAFMLVVGAGVGMVMQNLVLVVQNACTGRTSARAARSSRSSAASGARSASASSARCWPRTRAPRSPTGWPRRASTPRGSAAGTRARCRTSPPCRRRSRTSSSTPSAPASPRSSSSPPRSG